MTNVLEELWSGRTLVLSHRNADIDALGCSIALAAMFPEVDIGAVESISRGAQNLPQLGIGGLLGARQARRQQRQQQQDPDVPFEPHIQFYLSKNISL